MARKSLSNVDTAFLRMEDPTNLMMITGVLVFGAPLDFERLKATLETDLLRFDRFRQRVVPPRLPGGNYSWQDDPDLDLEYHLQRATLPPPGDQAALQETVSLLASTPLDPSKPLWQFHLVEEYGDGSALICRLHHSIADGIALVQVLLSLTDTAPDAPWPVTEPAGARQPGSRRGRGLFRPVRSALGKTARSSRTLVRQGLGMVVHPSRIVDMARLGTDGTTALGRLVLRWPDPKTVFKGELGVPKRAAWSEPIPLQEVKAVGKGLGGTVNDVLLTAMAGGLRRYLQGRGEPVDGLNVRAVVPVNLRPPDAPLELGNKFGLVFLSLPVGVDDPADRLRELKRRMDGIKDSLEAPVAFGILNTIGMSPAGIQDIMLGIFGAKGTVLMTNVIGPQEQIYLAGAPLEALMFWVPQSGRLGMGVSILSYNGQVLVGVITDEGLVPDPEAIIDGFHAEFDELLAMARKPGQEPDLRQMAAMLDETLAELEAMLEEKEPATTEMSEGAAAQCQALTKAGRRCKNPPLPGSEFCHVHQEQPAANT